MCAQEVRPQNRKVNIGERKFLWKVWLVVRARQHDLIPYMVIGILYHLPASEPLQLLISLVVMTYGTGGFARCAIALSVHMAHTISKETIKVTEIPQLVPRPSQRTRLAYPLREG